MTRISTKSHQCCSKQPQLEKLAAIVTLIVSHVLWIHRIAVAAINSLSIQPR